MILIYGLFQALRKGIKEEFPTAEIRPAINSITKCSFELHLNDKSYRVVITEIPVNQNKIRS